MANEPQGTERESALPGRLREPQTQASGPTLEAMSRASPRRKIPRQDGVGSKLYSVTVSYLVLRKKIVWQKRLELTWAL